ncbi:unnamed protein product [Arctogadus glacialis]
MLTRAFIPPLNTRPRSTGTYTYFISLTKDRITGAQLFPVQQTRLLLASVIAGEMAASRARRPNRERTQAQIDCSPSSDDDKPQVEKSVVRSPQRG